MFAKRVDSRMFPVRFPRPSNTSITTSSQVAPSAGIEAGDRILFPRAVVEKAIADAPRSFLLYDRDGVPHADLGGDRVHFVPGSSGLKWLDHRTGDVRLANTADFVEYVRVADGLPHIAYLATAFSTKAAATPHARPAGKAAAAGTSAGPALRSGEASVNSGAERTSPSTLKVPL